MLGLCSLLGLVLAFQSLFVSGLGVANSNTVIEYTPELVASQDFYKGSSAITFVNGGVPSLFSDSSVNLAGNAETQALRNYATHKNLRVIYTVAEVYYRIVANKASGITKVEDLKGKKIGSIPSTSAAYFVTKYMESVGVAENQYTIVSGGACMKSPCGAGTLPYMLQNKQVDAVGMWEPTLQLAIDALGTKAVVFNNQSIYREVFNLHSTSETLANAATRNATVQFIKALNQAEKVFSNNASSVYSRVSSAVGVSTSLLQEVWPIHAWRGTLAPDLLDVMVAEDQWVAKQDNRSPMSRDVIAQMIDSTVLADALKT